MCGISLIPDKAERMGRFSNLKVERINHLPRTNDETNTGIINKHLIPYPASKINIFAQ